MRPLSIVFIIFYFIHLSNTQSLRVETNSGSIEGIRIPGKCKEANAWYGIPFAKPPINELRYKRPIPIEPWSNTLRAHTKPKGCYQRASTDTTLDPGFAHIEQENISEDCLYLNVVTPINVIKPLPVMVWIHGGSFRTGATRMHIYDLECLSNYGDVVTVTVAYRLGNFGFLYLDEETAPGNLGLLDQQLAIKWVKENIEAFGGDPEKITIFGQSAGGASISYQLLAKGSKKLFKQAIVESGVAASLWSWIGNEAAQKIGKNFATRVGCDSDDNKAILECLQTVDAQTLLENEKPLLVTEFPPTTDGLFINEDPWALVGKTDFTGRHIFIGSTFDEGHLFAVLSLLGTGTDSNQIPKNVTRDDAKKNLDIFVKAYMYDNPDDTIEKILNFYAEKTENDNFQTVSKGAFSDPLMDCPINNFANILERQGAQVYKYVFTHGTKNAPWAKWGAVAAHSEELFYIFGEPLKKDAKIKFTLFEKILSKRMIKYWTDFAKTGELKRNLSMMQWPLYNEKDKKYVKINLKGTSEEEDFRGEYCEFFEELSK